MLPPPRRPLTDRLEVMPDMESAAEMDAPIDLEMLGPTRMFASGLQRDQMLQCIVSVEVAPLSAGALRLIPHRR